MTGDADQMARLIDEIAGLRADVALLLVEVRGPRPQPITVERETAAAMLDMSLRHFQRHVQTDLRLVRSGRKRLVRVEELERWAVANSDR